MFHERQTAALGMLDIKTYQAGDHKRKICATLLLAVVTSITVL